MIRRAPLPTRERIQFGWFTLLAAAIAGILVWLFWVLPVTRSVESAIPAELGTVLVQELSAQQTVGIWSTRQAATFGTARCTVAGPHGAAIALRASHDIGWDDTLWWMTAQPGFRPTHSFRAQDAGTYTVTCSDVLATYGGEYLLAQSTQGGRLLGVGRGGGASYPFGSVLAITAVGAPLLVIMLTPIMIVQTIRTRRRQDTRGHGGSPEAREV